MSPYNLALLDEFDSSEVLTRTQMLGRMDGVSLAALHFISAAGDETIRGTPDNSTVTTCDGSHHRNELRCRPFAAFLLQVSFLES